jgi:hypothetical protein
MLAYLQIRDKSLPILALVVAFLAWPRVCYNPSLTLSSSLTVPLVQPSDLAPIKQEKSRARTASPTHGPAALPLDFSHRKARPPG